MKRLLALLLLPLTLTSLARPTESAAEPGVLVGAVAETMNASRYTYMRVVTGGESHWVATGEMKVSVGDIVTVRGGTPMSNFTSPTLERTFDTIIFAENVQMGAGSSDAGAEAAALPPGHPPVAPHGAAGGATDSSDGIAGEIAETMDAGSYTYIKVKSDARTLWVAADKFPAKVGERVAVPSGVLMKNFESPSLKRKFDELLFADSIVTGADDATVTEKPTTKEEVGPAPEGALTVEQIHARRAELAGKVVTVRGKVVKYTPQVMKLNWIHLEDGTGAGENKDVTITSEGETAVGAVITATGTLALDEDLGSGYQFPVLIKAATLSP